MPKNTRWGKKGKRKTDIAGTAAAGNAIHNAVTKFKLELRKEVSQHRSSPQNLPHNIYQQKRNNVKIHR